MKEAISLFKAGVRVKARDTAPESVHTLRLVCGECLEPVILVQRGDSFFFAHWPRTNLSPDCSLRREWDGIDRDDPGNPKIDEIFERKAFQEAIQDIFGDADLDPPLAEEQQAWVRQLCLLMHEVWIKQKRCIDIRDLTGIPPIMVALWPPLETLVERFSMEAADGTPGAFKHITGYPSLKTAEHVKSVSLLWKQLHLKRVEEDLVFLFKTALSLEDKKAEHIEYKDFALFASDIIFTGLKVISAVPWLELSFEEGAAEGRVCSECGRAENPARHLNLEECHNCRALLCPDCLERCANCNIILCPEHAQRHREYRCPDCGQSICETYQYGEPNCCIVCGEEICAECHHLCEACNEPVCDDCFHDEWTCEKCGENFCEFKCESESVEKVECPRCNEPYCDNCAETDFVTCAGCSEKICENCLKECTMCGKQVCEECLKECSMCGEEICEECARECSGCSSLVCENCRSECPVCQETICGNCGEECVTCQEQICENCLQECPGCNNKVCKNCGRECADCGRLTCEDCLEECTACDRQVCNNCIHECSACGARVCGNCGEECAGCDEPVCNECLNECQCCRDNFCPNCLEEHEYNCVNDIDV